MTTQLDATRATRRFVVRSLGRFAVAGAAAGSAWTAARSVVYQAVRLFSGEPADGNPIVIFIALMTAILGAILLVIVWMVSVAPVALTRLHTRSRWIAVIGFSVAGAVIGWLWLRFLSPVAGAAEIDPIPGIVYIAGVAAVAVLAWWAALRRSRSATPI